MKRSPLATSAFALAAAQTAIFTPLSATAEPAQGWDLLQNIKITEEVVDGELQKVKLYPVRMRDGISEYELTGYVRKVTRPRKEFETFYLISDMGFCPWCGSLDHGAAVQVNLAEAILDLEDGDRITVRGALAPVADPEDDDYAALHKAEIVS